MRKILFLFIVALPVCARAGSWEVGPLVGQRFGGRFINNDSGNVYNVNSAPAVGFYAGKAFDYGNRYAEFLYSRQETDVDLNGLNGLSDLDINIESYYFGLMQLYGDDKFRPYLEGLIGFTHFNFSDTFKPNTLFSLGASGGFKYFASKRVGLRLEGRVYATFSGGGTAVACSGGCAMNYTGTAFWQGEISPSVFVQF